MERREPPQTAEGWYVLHDFRSVDWDAWRDAPERERERAIAEGVDYLQAQEAVADDDGGSATYAVLGHKADLLFVHLRPTLADIDRVERQFEGTAFAAYTERADSYVSVTEASAYSERAQEYFDDEDVDTGLKNYIDSRLEPSIPDDEFLSFYPMDKRRDPEYNWYDLSFEERAELMDGHGDIGRDYAGKVSQMITGSVGMDDHEWGVTLWADDMTDVKDLVYEMRFDPSSSRYAEFGRFYTGRRFPPSDLGAYLAGEAVPTADHAPHEDSAGHPHGEGDEGHGHAVSHGDDHAHHEDRDAAGHAPAASDDEGGAGGPPHHAGDEDDGIRGELADMNVYAGKPHGEDVYAMVLYSEADADALYEEVDGLRGNFEHYDTHVKTAVYENPHGGENAVVSIWDTQSAADTAGGFLADLPGIVRQAGDRAADEAADGERDGSPASDADSETWGTMGMFYTVKPDHREDFVEKFETVGGVLGDMDGHIETDLLANREDENDMFIASRWESKEHAMTFFRSDAFSDTVDWGRDVLADRPRHVFLA